MFTIRDCYHFIHYYEYRIRIFSQAAFTVSRGPLVQNKSFVRIMLTYNLLNPSQTKFNDIYNEY